MRWTWAIVFLLLLGIGFGAVVDFRENAVVTTIDDKVTVVRLRSTILVMKAGELPRVRSIATPKPQVVASKPIATKPAIRWTLPYTCSDVQYYATHFTATELDAMRKAAGMALPTPDQRAQINACLAGRVK